MIEATSDGGEIYQFFIFIHTRHEHMLNAREKIVYE